MTEQQIPLTYEGIKAMVREVIREIDLESDRKFDRGMEKSRLEFEQIMKGLAEQQKKTELAVERTNKTVGNLRSNVGKVIEHMVRGHIEEKFQALGYRDIDKCYQNVEFAQNTPNAGEIDLVLENGDVIILIEVKTRLQVPRVLKHIEKLGKYRRHVNSKKGKSENMRFIGAVAGAVVEDDAKDLAHENGMYVIVQSGKAVEIITPPEGFVAKEW
jgi:Holliday junction resolvase-like predicted endonuclease